MRWKAVIPVMVIMAVSSAALYLFRNSIIKASIQTAGSMLVGAKVEVGKVESSLINGSVTLKGIQVTNPKDPWKNLVDIQEAGLSVEIPPLLYRKLNVSDIRVLGLVFGKKRDESGALPEKTKKRRDLGRILRPVKKVVIKEAAKLPAAEIFSQKIDMKKVIDVENLASVRQAAQIKGSIPERKKAWEELAGSVKIPQEVQSLKGKRLDKIDDLNELKRFLEDLKRAASAIEATAGNIRAAEASFTGDIRALRESVRTLEDLKKKDTQLLLDKLNLKNTELKDLTLTLFGPVWVERVNKVLFLLSKTREFMDREEEIEPKPKERMRGMDIPFPVKKNYPDFLIKEINITSREEGEKPLAIDGRITGITDNQKVYGKPATLNVDASRSPAEETAYALTGLFDYTADIPNTEIDFEVTGIDLAGSSLDIPQARTSVTSGSARLHGGLTLKGDTIDSVIEARCRRVSLQGEEGNTIVKILKAVTGTLDSIDVEGRISGPIDSPSVRLSSNLEDAVSFLLNEEFKKRVKSARNELEKSVEAQVGPMIKEITEDINGAEKEIKDRIESKKREFEAAKQEVTARINEAQEEINEKGKQIEDKGKELLKKIF